MSDAIEAAALAIRRALTGICETPEDVIATAAIKAAAPRIEAAARADERAKVAEEAEVEWASFLAHSNSAGRGYACVSGHGSREDAQDMADHLATPGRPAWVGWRTVHPWQHDHPDPQHAAAIARAAATKDNQ